MERLGPPLPAAQSFRTRRGNGQVTVGINPDLRQLDVEREVRTYPTVRVVPVRGRSGLLFPRRPGNFYAGLTWEERPGLVVQVIAREGTPDQLLLDIAQGLQIRSRPPAPVTITVGPLPQGWVRVPASELPIPAGNLLVLPRSHHQVFTKGRNERPQFVIIETRDQHDPSKATDLDGLVPNSRREPVTVHGHPATLLSTPGNQRIPATHELADDSISRGQLLGIARGLRQP
jgi:hypothetical protein